MKYLRTQFSYLVILIFAISCAPEQSLPEVEVLDYARHFPPLISPHSLPREIAGYTLGEPVQKTHKSILKESIKTDSQPSIFHNRILLDGSSIDLTTKSNVIISIRAKLDLDGNSAYWNVIRKAHQNFIVADKKDVLVIIKDNYLLVALFTPEVCDLFITETISE